MIRTTAVIAATLLATACSDLPVETKPPMQAHVACHSDSLGWTVGKPADEALVKRAQLEASAKFVRVLHPNQVVTMEYSDERLNLHVDDKNIVRSYACG